MPRDAWAVNYLDAKNRLRTKRFQKHSAAKTFQRDLSARKIRSRLLPIAKHPRK